MKKRIKSALAVFTAALTLNAATCSFVNANDASDRVVNEAQSLIGISGRPNIITDYWNLITEWCAMTIVYVADKSGVSDSVPRSTFVDRSGEYIGFRDWYEERARFKYRGTYTPKKGDFIIFDWNDDDHGDHIGIVSGTDYSSVYTIEGNSNDSVAANAYNLSYGNILGYCTPDYNDDGNSYPDSYIEKDYSEDDYVYDYSENGDTYYEQGSIDYSECGSWYYVASNIGCNLRYSPDFSENIITVLDTDTAIIADHEENGFLYCRIDGTDLWGYVHKSVLSKYGENTYSYSCYPTHTVISEIGCNIREYASLDSDIITVLDTGTYVTVLYCENDFSYCEVVLDSGAVINGFIASYLLESLS